MNRFKRYAKRVAAVLAAVAVAYALLLIPDRDISVSTNKLKSATKQPFAWNQDAYWDSLEAQYQKIQKSGCNNLEPIISSELEKASGLLQDIGKRELNPDAREFSELEHLFFEIAPLIGGCKIHIKDYIRLATDIRTVIKKQSERWDMKSDMARTTLYRLIYGARSAIEEVIMQMPAALASSLTIGTEEPSETPSADLLGLRINSGDILVSRGGAPTSALIARGNDFPGNFSHIALVYVDPDTCLPRIVESHIEIGTVVSTIEEYLKNKKLRIMVLRLRADLPQMITDPLIPDKAAGLAFKRATQGHIPYDFEMNYKEHSRLFCSEVASAAYSEHGINLWMGVSHISSAGLRKWLSGFGVRYFETQEPSDLEYDPQIRVVAEWRDPEALRKDRLDNAVTEVMLEGAEEGDELMYNWYLLPLARLMKFYSVMLNLMGKLGPIPEGMPATAALRAKYYSDKHDTITRVLKMKADRFKVQHGYEPPYWQLVKLARLAKYEIEKETTL